MYPTTLSPYCSNGSLMESVDRIFSKPVPTGTNAVSCSTTPVELKGRLDLHHRRLWDREDTLNLVVSRATDADSSLREFLKRVEEKRALSPVIRKRELEPISDVETLDQLPAADTYLRHLSYCLLHEAGADPARAIAIDTRHFDLRLERLSGFVDDRVVAAPSGRRFNAMSSASTMSTRDERSETFIDGAVLTRVVQKTRHRRRGSILACVRETREARGFFPFICMRADCAAFG